MVGNDPFDAQRVAAARLVRLGEPAAVLRIDSAACGAARSWAQVRVLPLAINEKAAEILGVEARLLMPREY